MCTTYPSKATPARLGSLLTDTLEYACCPGFRSPSTSGAQFSHRLRSRLQVRFGLHVAQGLRGGVLHRCVDRLGCRVVTGGYGQPAQNAVPGLVQGDDGAGHGGFHGGLVVGPAALGAFGAVGPALAAATLTAFATGLASFGSAAHFGVGDPAGEGRRRRGQVDVHHLARSQVHRGGRAKLRSVGEVDFDSDVGQDVVGGVLHECR